MKQGAISTLKDRLREIEEEKTNLLYFSKLKTDFKTYMLNKLEAEKVEIKEAIEILKKYLHQNDSN